MYHTNRNAGIGGWCSGAQKGYARASKETGSGLHCVAAAGRSLRLGSGQCGTPPGSRPLGWMGPCCIPSFMLILWSALRSCEGLRRCPMLRSQSKDPSIGSIIARRRTPNEWCRCRRASERASERANETSFMLDIGGIQEGLRSLNAARHGASPAECVYLSLVACGGHGWSSRRADQPHALCVRG